MLTKEQALASLDYETRTVKYLATKVEAGHLDYKPSEPQRTLLDLLQYLTCAVDICARNIVTGNWDHAGEMSEQSKIVTLDSFPAAMDAQFQSVVETLKDMDGPALQAKTVAMPWGAECTAGEAFFNMCVKILVAYRMQMFLYLRAQGVAVETSDCWAGGAKFEA